MNNQPQNILFGEDVIDNANAYPALPNVLCHRCGSKLYRICNTQNHWKYMYVKERILVDLENEHRMLEVEVD